MSLFFFFFFLNSFFLVAYRSFLCPQCSETLWQCGLETVPPYCAGQCTLWPGGSHPTVMGPLWMILLMISSFFLCSRFWNGHWTDAGYLGLVLYFSICLWDNFSTLSSNLNSWDSISFIMFNFMLLMEFFEKELLPHHHFLNVSFSKYLDLVV